MNRRCIDCAALTTRASRCPLCQRMWDAARNHRRTQYQGGWGTLSRQRRQEHPWCSVCHRTKEQLDQIGVRLSLDHETDTVQCVPCNASHRRDPGQR